jgi:hypothetical protein
MSPLNSPPPIMSAFGGKADVIRGAAKRPLLAKRKQSAHWKGVACCSVCLAAIITGQPFRARRLAKV